VRDLFLVLAVTQTIAVIIGILAADSRPLSARLTATAVVVAWAGW
jgi:hypothetical protein